MIKSAVNGKGIDDAYTKYKTEIFESCKVDQNHRDMSEKGEIS